MEIKKQIDVKDCGVVIIQALHRYHHDRWIKINKIKRLAKYSSNGINIKNMIELGEQYGINLEALKGTWESLVETNPKEWIITLLEIKGENHYVMFKLGKNNVKVLDPIKGRYSIKRERFKELFKGVLIIHSKMDYHKSKDKLKSPFRLILKHPMLLSWILIALVISLALTFVSTIFMKLILDKVLPGHLTSLLLVLTIGFGALSVIRALNSFFKKYLIKKFQLNIETSLNAAYFHKIRNARTLDLMKVEQSDHLRRISIIESVSSFMASSLFIVFYEILNFIVATSLLLWISPKLFGIALAAGGISALITIVIQYLIKDKYDPLLEKQLSYLNTSMDHVFSIEEIKEPRTSRFLKEKQESKFLKYKWEELKIWFLSSIQSLFSDLVTMLFPIVLTYIATNLVMDNSLSAGSMIMFLGIFHSFISPIEDLCTIVLRYKQNTKNIEMISFVLNLPDTPLNTKGIKPDKIERLTFNNYNFGYDKFLYNMVWQEFKGNTHLVGPNGSGKSTLLKVMACRIFKDGEYSINGTALEYYNLIKVREKIFFLDSDPYLPTGSVIDYITLNNPSAIDCFNKNMLNYNLSKLFGDLKISMEMQIVNNGSNLSSGQKQIIALMRLFAFEYDLIILDEALENIDHAKVKWLAKSLNQVQDGMFMEVSHSKRYISKAKEVDIEEITEGIH